MTEAAALWGLGDKRAARSSRCAATLYRDGRLDLVVNNFNDRAYYFRNRFPNKNYIAFRLTGSGNTAAIEERINFCLASLLEGKSAEAPRKLLQAQSRKKSKEKKGTALCVK